MTSLKRVVLAALLLTACSPESANTTDHGPTGVALEAALAEQIGEVDTPLLRRPSSWAFFGPRAARTPHEGRRRLDEAAMSRFLKGGAGGVHGSARRRVRLFDKVLELRQAAPFGLGGPTPSTLR